MAQEVRYPNQGHETGGKGLTPASCLSAELRAGSAGGPEGAVQQPWARTLRPPGSGPLQDRDLRRHELSHPQVSVSLARASVRKMASGQSTALSHWAVVPKLSKFVSHLTAPTGQWGCYRLSTFHHGK